MTTVSKIEVKNVFKIFGNRSREALALVGQGKTKDQVLAETGCVVGVNDLSLSIATGEIFVIMGLSGSGKSTLVRHFNRLIDPTSGATKRDLADYYIRISDWLLPQLAQRPVALVRAPEGIGGELFFQKHAARQKIPGIGDSWKVCTTPVAA